MDTLQKDTGFIVEPKIRRKKNYIKFSKVGPKIHIGANHKDQICNSLQNNDSLSTSSSFIKSIILIKLYQHMVNENPKHNDSKTTEPRKEKKKNHNQPI